MDTLGAPVAYLALPDGVPVYDPTGAEVGTVEHVLADEQQDIFHGLIVRTRPVDDRALFADREQIDDLFERGVRLAVPAADLHRPDEDPVAADAAGTTAQHAREGLRRAWEWLNRAH